ncbi:L-amino-acid oxidase-like protein [Parathielavia hyrcaniae]|uniref:L-amino-acid oxidase-like protein n=1 Tax=Parathielavia hyrcaniae TaxID=113614 RepID=A0AAN6PVV7_9PEZI|nr:L-amino-acid oxidase-like protein [Parathielavia hyrcaniae]
MTGLTLPLLFLGGAAAASAGLPVQLETRSALNSRLANVHVAVTRSVEGPITVAYGPCTSSSIHEAHHVLGETHGSKSEGTRLVWILPEDTKSGGCLSAWTSTGKLAGRSEPQLVQGLQKRRTSKRAAGIPMDNSTGIDVLGPWFDGVALLKDKQPGRVDVEAAKAKEVAIVGAGMSGLMSYLVLTQAGMTNVTILEAGQRLGGRVRTEYLSGGPFDYSYQEMGPMRFPYSYQDPATGETLNITDHQLVFQLAAEMNRINGNDKKLSVGFIRWIQTNPNGLVYRNGFKLASGLPPTVAQIRADPSLGAPVKAMDESTKALAEAVEEHMPTPEFYAAAARNMFKAHKDWIENGLKGLGGDTWSEFAFMVNYLGASLNDTDVRRGGLTSFWEEIFEGLYFQASEWRTIDGGLNRLPQSFEPLVEKDIHMNRQIERIQFLTQPPDNGTSSKVQLHWRDTSSPSRISSALRTSTYDYSLISVPFPVVRSWRLPSSLPTTITNAINNLAYSKACKVALEYRTRFWEAYEGQPIAGGCSTTSDIPGIGTICYPSYDLNGTGPATLLASYSTLDWPNSLGEDEHVQMVLDAVTEIHGDETRALYTGRYNRRCWAHDPLTRASWASPTIGQHLLYIPEYFKTYDGLIFIGEHTSYTHAWIASALESGIRGSVQLLLELGLVDEAKEVVNKWMARWIDI